jgi:hypothetical protein
MTPDVRAFLCRGRYIFLRPAAFKKAPTGRFLVVEVQAQWRLSP